jgi:hypothetical protein
MAKRRDDSGAPLDLQLNEAFRGLVAARLLSFSEVTGPSSIPLGIRRGTVSFMNPHDSGTEMEGEKKR